MENYTITIRTISPLCLGSGQADVNVDADIVWASLLSREALARPAI